MSDDLNAMHYGRTSRDHTGDEDADESDEETTELPGDDDLWAQLG